MNECKLKHLEFIQSVITRLSTNSFLIKGWSVTLVAGIFALAAKDSNIKYAVVAYFPAFTFWALDGFFLSQEKQYRALFSAVASKNNADIDFNLDASHFAEGDRTWLRCVVSKTLFPFHGALVLVVCIVMLVFPNL